MQQQDTEPPRSVPTQGSSESFVSYEQPGVLRGAITLKLETRQAQRMVKGRAGTAEKPAIVGLIGFANLLRSIWHGARANDPYADWWLVKVHQALEESGQALKESLATVQDILASTEAIIVTPGASARPVCTPLRFSNPYAYRGARLIAEYDGLARAVLTARHIGVVTRDDAESILALGGRQVRRAYFSPMGYRLTGITRDDVFQRTARYSQAQASMGDIPENVLSGELRAPHAPVRPMPDSRWAQHLELQPQSAKA